MTNTLPSSQSTSSASSSIAHFPTFHFSLRTLTPLRVALAPVGRGSVKVNLLVAVMDVEGADTITTKAGQETHLLKLVVGDDEGAAGKISVWGETALEWAGAGKMMGLRRGDIVYLSGTSGSNRLYLILAHQISDRFRYSSDKRSSRLPYTDRLDEARLGNSVML
jgi:hypothetical protein